MTGQLRIAVTTYAEEFCGILYVRSPGNVLKVLKLSVESLFFSACRLGGDYRTSMADFRVAGPQLSRRVVPCCLNSYTVIKFLLCTLVFAGTISGDGTEGESSGTRVRRMVQTNIR